MIKVSGKRRFTPLIKFPSYIFMHTCAKATTIFLLLNWHHLPPSHLCHWAEKWRKNILFPPGDMWTLCLSHFVPVRLEVFGQQGSTSVSITSDTGYCTLLAPRSWRPGSTPDHSCEGCLRYQLLTAEFHCPLLLQNVSVSLAEFLVQTYLQSSTWNVLPPRCSH